MEGVRVSVDLRAFKRLVTHNVTILFVHPLRKVQHIKSTPSGGAWIISRGTPSPIALHINRKGKGSRNGTYVVFRLSSPF